MLATLYRTVKFSIDMRYPDLKGLRRVHNKLSQEIKSIAKRSD